MASQLQNPFGDLTDFIQNCTWSFSVTHPDYAASAWTLTYYFRGAGGKLDVVATAAGSGWTVAIPATDTKKLNPGRYKWQAVLSQGAERYQVGFGSLEVQVDFAGTDAADQRSHDEKMLDAITAMQEGRATRPETEYKVATSNGGERSLKLLSPKELEEARGIYQNRVNKALEANVDRRAQSNQIQVRFGSL